MNNGDDVWICLSDLFAGLMAFFIFVCVGIFTSYTELEAEMFGGDKHTANVQTEDNATMIHGLTVGVDYIYFNSHQFKNGQWALTDQNAATIPFAVKTVERWLANDEYKILFIGHASCTGSVKDAEMAKIHGEDWEKFKTDEKSVERQIAIYDSNYRLSVRRAYELYKTFKEKSEIISKLGDDRIQFIGMSEVLAASGQGGIICGERDAHKDDANYRSAEIRVVRQWPTLFKVNAEEGSASKI